MLVETPALRRLVDLALQVPSAGASNRHAMRVHESYSARSARNITTWRAYLPDDCVTSMIKMGWDRTT